MKNIPAAVLAQMSASEAKPVNLYTLNLDGITLRFAQSNTNVSFPSSGGSIYVAKAIELNPIQHDYSGNVIRIKVSFDNASKDMAAYEVAYQLQGKVLNINRVYRDALTNATYYNEVINCVIESYEIDYYWLTITAVNGWSLSSRCPSRIYQRKCPWVFGGAECNTDGLTDLTTSAYKKTGLALSGTTTKLVSILLSQTDNYWKYGRLTCTQSGISQTREVSSSSKSELSVTVAIPFSFDIDSDTSFVLIKGCNKLISTCKGLNTYGPNTDNRLNFGGFPSVGRTVILSTNQTSQVALPYELTQLGQEDWRLDYERDLGYII